MTALSESEALTLARIEAEPDAPESLRERVAVAMCATDVGRPLEDDEWQSIDPLARRSYRRLADAVLDVLRGLSTCTTCGEAQAAIERAAALADELDTISDEHYAAYQHSDPSDTRRGSAYTEGFCVGFDSAADRLRAALRGTP